MTELIDKELILATDDIGVIINNVCKVIVGKPEAVELAVIGLLSGGHILIEDVPGVGKTVLARSIAASIACSFNRIQFTPDLLPTDVSGVSIYNQKTGDFEFREGPIVSQIVLADEINRATPKTQSAMLEAMEENQVTVEGITRALPSPFMVMATQNPIEYEGTFPLPEAQLDRFLLKISLGYPNPTQETEILDSQSESHPIEELYSVTSPEKIASLQSTVKNIFVHDLVKQYIVSLVGSTRENDNISLGSSPRGSLGLYRASQAMALIRGRQFVIPDDVKELAVPVLGHRLILSASARMNGHSTVSIIESILSSTPVPGAETRGWLRTS